MTGGLHVPGLLDQRARSAHFRALLSCGLTSPAASVPTHQLTPRGDTAGYGGPAQAPLAGWHLSPTPLHTCPQRAFERLSEVPVAKNNPGESTKSLRANVVTFIFKNSGEPLALAFLGQKVALGCDGPRAGVLPLGPV